MFDAFSQAMDMTLFWRYREILLMGLWYNFLIFVLAAILANVLGLGAAILRVSRHRPLRWIGTVHVELFRNAPDYVMVIWIHFVLPILITMMIGKRFELHPVTSAVIALGLVYSGYFAEMYRAGILAIPRGNVEAGQSAGMADGLILRRIVLPQVMRRVLPEMLNLCVSLFKGTTIVSLIAVPDLMYRVSMVTQQEMRPLPLYTGAAIVYFLIIISASTLARAFGDRWVQRSQI
ncbi:MAG TPA: amino acid ABC transporter permease [Devosia sp.]|nr:amino acid ABC transporter permease [Devosia sp.]